jgi:hypothetical protein
MGSATFVYNESPFPTRQRTQKALSEDLEQRPASIGTHWQTEPLMEAGWKPSTSVTESPSQCKQRDSPRYNLPASICARPATPTQNPRSR